MIQIRKSADRGTFDHGWLVTRHTFSFADYRDIRFMGFSDLRVINEDDVAPGKGFATHPHHDMEIVSYIVKGTIAHRDSMGNVTQIREGEIQVMTAGTGVEHSEFNPSSTEPMKLIQIWIKPSAKDLTPHYNQRQLDAASLRNQWGLLAAPPGEGGLPLNQDARIYATRLEAGASADFGLPLGRQAWVQIVSGRGQLNGTPLDGGDGASATDESRLSLKAETPLEALLFDLR